MNLFNRNWLALTLSAATFLLWTSVSLAHSTDETYVWLNPVEDHYAGEVQMRLPDLRNYLKLEGIPDDVEGARVAIEGHSDAIEKYVREHFEIKTLEGERVDFEITGFDVLESNHFKHFAKILYKTQTFEQLPEKVIVKSDLLFEHDKYSRSILCMNYSSFKGDGKPKPDGKGVVEDGFEEGFFHTIFTPWNPEQEVDLVNVSQVLTSWQYYLWEGIRHIWIGTDHILFLVTLLLASVLVRRSDPEVDQGSEGISDDSAASNQAKAKSWFPVSGFSGAFWNILKIVTVFTVAHSITLALASLDVISMEGWIVESIIAFSIILVALNNIFPFFHDRTWIVLFAFGLFHGMGFASVMRDLPFRMGDLTTLLLSFNVGVELGQLVIVIAVFPLIFFLRKWKLYQPVVLVGASLAICAWASIWLYERAILGDSLFGS